MKNIFLVASPFQLICAIEARHRFYEKDGGYLIVIGKEGLSSTGYIQVSNLLDDRWRRIIRLQEVKTKGVVRSFYRVWLTLKILICCGFGRGRVFIGDYRVSWFRILGKVLGDEVVCIDDGASTIPLLQKLKDENFDVKRLGFNLIFTIFDNGYFLSKSNGAIVPNNLCILGGRRISPQDICSKKIFILGQWLSEASLLPIEYELDVLNRVRDHFSKSNLAYIPHRLESSCKLDRLSLMDFDIIHSSRPIEYYLMDLDELPGVIVSWYSTALFVIKKLFPEIRLISIKPKLSADASMQRVFEINQVYDFIDSLDIDIIEVTDDFFINFNGSD